MKIPVETYSRVSGYYRPVAQWNPGKREEFKERNFMNQRNLKETPALLKAIEIERQLVNISLYNYKSAQMLCDIPEDEFIRKENKEIRRAILSLLCENSKPSVTIIANKIHSSLKNISSILR